MRVCEILTADMANGTGMRVTVFVSGCLNHCKGCFQPETWDFDYGHVYSKEIEDLIIKELAKPYYEGITFLGGDPFEIINQEGIWPLIERIRKELPNRNIWMYTGYLYDKDLVPGGRRYLENITDKILDNIDILVDGPFVEHQKSILLKFRGSSNQRIIDMRKTRTTGSIVLAPWNT